MASEAERPMNGLLYLTESVSDRRLCWALGFMACLPVILLMFLQLPLRHMVHGGKNTANDVG